jgi:leucine dehydrogenase
MEHLISHNPADEVTRRRLFQAYGKFVSRLGGTYYTAADLNTYNSDMVDVLSTTRFVTCLPIDRGGSGDPSPMTARGVFESMQAAWDVLFSAPLSGVRVAVQGVGKVGKPLTTCLAEAGARLWLADFDQDVAERVARSLRDEHPGVEIEVVGRDEILRAPVDVIAPCAVGGVIDEAVIDALHPDVRLVCGGANNILDDEDRDAALLHARGVTFIPDFLCNRMGIINCADEWLGYSMKDVEDKIPDIPDDTRTLLRQVRDSRRNTLEEARAMADKRLGAEEHPLRELRGRGRKLAEAFASHLGE